MTAFSNNCSSDDRPFHITVLISNKHPKNYSQITCYSPLTLRYLFSPEHCPPQTVHSGKGVFRWNSTSHGRAQLIECPFGSTFPDRESATGYAKRRCYLLSNGSVAWGRMDLSSCREEVGFCINNDPFFFVLRDEKEQN